MGGCRLRFLRGLLAAVACSGWIGDFSSVSAAVVGHWPLDDGLARPNTTDVIDVSGNELHGKLFNLAGAWMEGSSAKQGGALDFRDQVGYVNLDLGDHLPVANAPRTLAAWVLARAADDAKFLSYGSQKPGRSFDFTIELHDGEPHVYLRHWGGNMRYPGAEIGQFMHFAAVVPDDATFTSDVQVYVNGRRSIGLRGAGDDWKLLTDASPLMIGARSDAFDFFDGIVDDVWLLDEALNEFEIRALMRGTYGIAPGDFNQNGQLDVADLDGLTSALLVGSLDTKFDLDGDGRLEANDRHVWISQLKRIHIGDSNLDGRFNSSDLVRVFQAGEFEDSFPLNSTWEEGDWNGDGDFTTADFVLAFQEGAYVAQATGPLAVPEPAAWSLASAAAMIAGCRTRRR